MILKKTDYFFIQDNKCCFIPEKSSKKSEFNWTPKGERKIIYSSVLTIIKEAFIFAN